ncbi:hypothetical protein O159_05830 [Leifsonia xyli subsp. cynodontis DSM 46306]|uniref:Uncharacterized protein n=1 Tax=Leifsonia xyli subsp. cynodontis DSM 46306 TaxID=1389489 RepID=U3P766_LEIXC|nr:hypothetical protein O159_05830 [Leifsonia xyli subsp. cynodontis DSM 46306]
MTMSQTAETVNGLLSSRLKTTTPAEGFRSQSEVTCLSVAAVMAYAAFLGAEATVDVAVGVAASAATALAV